MVCWKLFCTHTCLIMPYKYWQRVRHFEMLMTEIILRIIMWYSWHFNESNHSSQGIMPTMVSVRIICPINRYFRSAYLTRFQSASAALAADDDYDASKRSDVQCIWAVQFNRCCSNLHDYQRHIRQANVYERTRYYKPAFSPPLLSPA